MQFASTIRWDLTTKRVFFALFILVSFTLFSDLRTSSTRAFRSTFSQSRMSNVPGNLSAWLSNTKTRFLEDLKKDGAKSWTVAMGNEAGGERTYP